MNRIQNLPRPAKLDARGLPGGTLHPARVHQPARDIVLLQTLSKLFSVHRGVPHKKRSSEARTEGGGGFDNPHLRTRYLCGVPTDELVHRLGLRKLADGREASKGVVRQKDDILWVTPDGGKLYIVDVVQRVGAARVFCDTHIVVLHHPAVIQHNILHNTAEPNRVEDVGLIVLGEPNRLGVAPPFDVKDPVIGPHVLVVPDELTMGIGRERSLSRPAESKKHGDIT
mmetsp:Transcript_2438/g.3256  ORF Transcript_2438/g.3256 Transcript_2438/m.3256 type:complete len:227 (-) Transcript_2438:744-1424(-)